MKKGLIILVILMVVSFPANRVINFTNNWGRYPLFNVVSSRADGIDIIFSIHRIVIEEIEIDGEVMQVYGVPGIFLPNDAGAPNLAGTGRYIAIPKGARAEVKILDARTEVYHNVEIAPAPVLPFENDDSPLKYEKDMQIYGRDAYYPDVPVKLSAPTQIRGVDVVILGVTPFQYNPVTKELIIYKDLRIRVNFIGGNGHFGEDRLRSPYWEPILQEHLLNYNSLPKIDFYSPERLRARGGYEYIIIVPDDQTFISYANQIKAWRKLQGISCEVFTLNQVGGSSATAIENFLNNAYNNWTPAPVAFLLLSDYPSSGEGYGITSPTWNNYCVSDNIYADVNGDDLPDMFSARLCAQNATHLDRMVNKFLSYEQNPYTAANFYSAPLVSCAWQTERWFQLCAEVIRGFFIHELSKNPARQYAVYSGTPTAGCSWSTATNTSAVVNYWNTLGYIPQTNPYDETWWNNGSASGINSAINSGAFLVQHRDHGAVTGWGEPSYTTSDLNGLTNTMFPFVYSTNCLTGKYNYSSECFTEKFHRIQYGALGVNAASEISYSFVNDVYIWGTYDGLWSQFDPGYPTFHIVGSNELRPAAAMVYGKFYLQASSWPYNTQNKVHTYHLFHHHGDAFTTLYSQVPQNLNVSHSSVLYTNQTSFSVKADAGSVIALTVNGEIIGVAQGTGNYVAIPIPPQNPGWMKVTVTKANYRRYEGNVHIIEYTPPSVLYLQGWPLRGPDVNIHLKWRWLAQYFDWDGLPQQDSADYDNYGWFDTYRPDPPPIQWWPGDIREHNAKAPSFPYTCRVGGQEPQYGIWYYMSNWVTIYKNGSADPVVVHCSDSLALYPSWSQKIVVDSLENIHIVFTSNDSVYYVYSQDKGYTFSNPVAIGEGKFPAIGISNTGLGVVFLRRNKIYYTRKTETWTTPISIYQNPSVERIVPPAFGIDKVNNIAYLCMEEEYADRSEITKVNFDLNLGQITMNQLDWSPNVHAFASPSLSLTRGGTPIITWSKMGKVYLNDGMTTIEIPSGDGYATDPSVSAVGDNIKLIWTATNEYDNEKQIYYAERGWWGWTKPIPLTETNLVSQPVITGTGHIFYSDYTNDTTTLRYFGVSEDCWHIYSKGVVYNTAGIRDINAISYPTWPKNPDYIIFYVPNQQIKLAKINAPEIPIIYLDCGTGKSPYTLGYYQNLYYGNSPDHIADMDSNQLEYHFISLNPNKRYRLKITAFQDEESEISEWIEIDGHRLGQLKVPRRMHSVFEKWIPPSYYDDGEICLTLKKKDGFAVASEIFITEFNQKYEEEIGRGGIQSDDDFLSLPNVLILPNPSKASTKILFDLIQDSPVTIKIYDGMGRLVKNLTKSDFKKGAHTIIWNGNDNDNRSAPNGAYFILFDCAGQRQVIKMLLIR